MMTAIWKTSRVLIFCFAILATIDLAPLARQSTWWALARGAALGVAWMVIDSREED